MPQLTERYKSLLEETAAREIDWHRLHGARVMVTGVTGLIGSFLTDLLATRNERFGNQISINACARNLSAARARFSAHKTEPGFELTEYDVTAPFPGTDEFDYIIHAAAGATPSVFSADPVGTLMSTVIGTQNVLDLGRKCGVKRVLLLSSGEIYGRVEPENIPFREEDLGWIDILSPRSCYPSGKRAAETLCAAYRQQYGVESVIARPCHVYGPTPTQRDTRASTQFLNEAAMGRDIVMKSEGLQMRSYLHVADCAIALLTVLLRGEAGRAYNIASEDSVLTVSSFASKCAEAGGVRVLFEAPSDGERRGYAPVKPQILDASSLKGLGFQARFNPDLGIQNVLEILKEKEPDARR